MGSNKMANEIQKIYKLRKAVLNIGIAFVFLLTSCATTSQINNKKVPKEVLKQKTEILINEAQLKPLNTDLIKEKLKQFKLALGKKNLTEADWKLHDELLDYYIRLKRQNSTKVVIPPKSRLTRDFETYCLNGDKAAPQNKEVYHWQKGSPDILYYKNLLKLRRQNQISQHDLQELLWNLQSQTRWDDYPNHLKAVLLKIDPQAAIKLPSQFKDQAQDLMKGTLLGLPGVGETQDIYGLLKGKYRQYSEFKNSVEKLSSQEQLGDDDELTEISSTELYTQSESQSYSGQRITFFNPTDQVKELDLENYYLAPERKDVQRIGLNPVIDEDPNLFTDLEKTLFETMARLGIGFTPFVNDVADVYELLAGKDFVSGKDLTVFERALSGVGVLVGSGVTYRYAKRAIFSPVEYIDEFSKGLSSIAKRSVQLDVQGLAASESALAQATSKTGTLKNQIGSLKESLELLKNNQVSRAGRREVIEAFSKDSKVIKLSQDTKVYRYSLEGQTLERGRWVTPSKVSNPHAELALPKSGTYKVNEWTIPKGTEVIEGLASPHFGQPGGASQIYIPNPEVLK